MMNFECLLSFIMIFKRKALKISKNIRRYTKSIGETAMKRHYMRRNNSRREFQTASLALSCFPACLSFLYIFFFISLSVVAAYINYLPLSFFPFCFGFVFMSLVRSRDFFVFLFYFLESIILFVTKKVSPFVF